MGQEANMSVYKSYEVKTTLSKSTFLEGTLSFKDSLRINGKYKGNITEGNLLVLGPHSEITGDIHVGTVIIGGTVKGNVYASEKLECLSTAKIYGNLYTKKIKIADGVIFEGECVMHS